MKNSNWNLPIGWFKTENIPEMEHICSDFLTEYIDVTMCDPLISYHITIYA